MEMVMLKENAKEAQNDNVPAVRKAEVKVRVKTINGKLTDKHYKATMKALHGKFGRTQ